MSAVTGLPGSTMWGAAATVGVLIIAGGGMWCIHLIAGTDQQRRDRLRDLVGSVISYLLLFFFWSVAAGLTATNLVGFGRDQMRLPGVWPYLLYFALDGAAAFCMVLIMRRSNRGDSAAALRLFVWALIAGSSWFNEAHAPHNAAARAAFMFLPVIAAVLFEFALAESRRRLSIRRSRRIAAVRWLHPAERFRVQLALAADEHLTVDAATHRVRVERAAAGLYRLRHAASYGRCAPKLRRGLTERRAQAALVRVRFHDSDVAVQVLGQVQILVRARDLAHLDYTSSEDVQSMLGSLLGSAPPLASAPSSNGAVPTAPLPVFSTVPLHGRGSVSLLDAPTETGSSPQGRAAGNGFPLITRPGKPAPATGMSSAELDVAGQQPDRGDPLVIAARNIFATAQRNEQRLTQGALARQLRELGFSIANDRLADIAAQIGLRPDHAHGRTHHA